MTEAGIQARRAMDSINSIVPRILMIISGLISFIPVFKQITGINIHRNTVDLRIFVTCAPGFTFKGRPTGHF